MNDNIISLHSRPEWRVPAARWFQEKWGIPLEEYLASIDESIRGTAAVPQWYIAVDGGRIIAGAGVIANDFHDRKDLTPNVCALYVEPELRRRGIAGHLLEHICKDIAAKGIGTLYLITEHASFYERYGWEYLCMVRGDDGELMRMYKKDAPRDRPPAERLGGGRLSVENHLPGTAPALRVRHHAAGHDADAHHRCHDCMGREGCGII